MAPTPPSVSEKASYRAPIVKLSDRANCGYRATPENDPELLSPLNDVAFTPRKKLSEISKPPVKSIWLYPSPRR